MKTLTGTLVYVQVQEPVDCFDKAKGQEWKASIVVDEDTADAWAEEYNKQPATVVKTSDFKEKYKIDPPFPDAKKQYIITLRKNTKLGNGNDVPELYQPKALMNVDGKMKDITKSVLIANGSKGSISVDTWEAKLGKVARLKNILVTELIEYERPEGETGTYTPGSEFGDLVASSSPKVAKTATKAPSKTAKAVELEDDDAPF